MPVAEPMEPDRGVDGEDDVVVMVANGDDWRDNERPPTPGGVTWVAASAVVTVRAGARARGESGERAEEEEEVFVVVGERRAVAAVSGVFGDVGG